MKRTQAKLHELSVDPIRNVLANRLAVIKVKIELASIYVNCLTKLCSLMKFLAFVLEVELPQKSRKTHISSATFWEVYAQT